MKRLLLLPVLMLGLSFACDQPYEEVAGIKIGCPLQDVDGIDGYTESFDMLGAKSVHAFLNEGDFFESQYVINDDNTVEGVSLLAKNVSEDEVEDLLNQLGSRWGDWIPDIKGDRFYAIYPLPNSDVIDRVTVEYGASDKILIVIYQSKNLTELSKTREQKNKEETRNRFNGL